MTRHSPGLSGTVTKCRGSGGRRPNLPGGIRTRRIGSILMKVIFGGHDAALKLNPGGKSGLTLTSTSPGPGGTLKLSPGTSGMQTHGLGGVEVMSHG